MKLKITHVEQLRLLENGVRLQWGEKDTRERNLVKTCDEFLIVDDGGGSLIEQEMLDDCALLAFLPELPKQRKFRRKPNVVEAYQWFEVSPYIEGVTRDVDYYRHPRGDGQEECKHCTRIMHDHGWMDTLEGGHIVCPGDWVVTGVEGEKYPCKPRIFEKNHEAVE